ncbi:MAG TPA: GNAT family N-acetyltransferase [Longimicrobium sp.]
MGDSKFRELVLNLDGFDPARAAAAARELEARGIVFATLAEEQERRPAEWLRELTDLENATRAHIDAPRTPAEMIERLAFLKVAPEALFLARSGERYLGYTCLNVRGSDGETLVQGWTGVRPEERGRGLATALKLHAAAYARTRGYRRILTAPRWTNTASLRANEKVGFRPAGEEDGPPA